MEEFAAIWSGTESVEFGRGVLGGHAYPPARAVHSLLDGTYFAVDGETALYSAADAYVASSGPPLWQIGPTGLQVRAPHGGNLAIYETTSDCWFIAADAVGAYPLYFSTAAGGLLFSALLLPLARALGAVSAVAPDLVGVLERVQSHCLQIRRTYFKGVSVLLAGQVLRYEALTNRLEISETSDLWTQTSEISEPTEMADVCWEALCADADHTRTLGRVALMMSGGWDSRTLLSVLRRSAPGGELLCYTHGDLRSRELAISRRLCKTSGVPLVNQALTSEVYDPRFLDSFFPRVETARFPEWLLADGMRGPASTGYR